MPYKDPERRKKYYRKYYVMQRARLAEEELNTIA